MVLGEWYTAARRMLPTRGGEGRVAGRSRLRRVPPERGYPPHDALFVRRLTSLALVTRIGVSLCLAVRGGGLGLNSALGRVIPVCGLAPCIPLLKPATSQRVCR